MMTCGVHGAVLTGTFGDLSAAVQQLNEQQQQQHV